VPASAAASQTTEAAGIAPAKPIRARTAFRRLRVLGAREWEIVCFERALSSSPTAAARQAEESGRLHQ